MVVRQCIASFSCQIRDGFQLFLQLKVGFMSWIVFFFLIMCTFVMFVESHCKLHDCIGMLCSRWWLRIICSEKQQQFKQWQPSEDQNCKVLHSFAVFDFGGDNWRKWTVTLFVDSVYGNIVVKFLSAEWTVSVWVLVSHSHFWIIFVTM